MRRRKRVRLDAGQDEDGGDEDVDDDEEDEEDPHAPGRRGGGARGGAAVGPGGVPLRSLVVGGVEAAPGQFPYQAGLLVSRRGAGGGVVGLCGAALLSDRWLITAAHCCREGHKIQVFLGSHPTMRDAQQRMGTGLVMLHPLYSKDVPGHNDLALIRLPKPVRLNDRVRPVRLPAWRHRTNDFAGDVATLSGWGKTSDDDQRPVKGTAVLRFARERVLHSEEAEALLKRKLPPTFLCVRGLRGEVSCNGDSGGPLTVQGVDGHPMLVGVVSHRYGQWCGLSRAHVCTRITSFLPWIAAVTRVPVEH